MSRIKQKKQESPPTPSASRKLSAYVAMSEPSDQKVSLPISLAAKKLKGNKQNKAGRKYSGSADFLIEDYAEYLYLTNSYVARGVDTESEAIIRNGVSIKPNNTSDQDAIDAIIATNNLTVLIKDLNTYAELYGQPMTETYDNPETKSISFEILPPTEMDYLRDASQNVLYDPKTGEPAGYTQTRDGTKLYTWQGEDAKRIAVFKYRTLGGYIEGIPGIQTILYPANEYGNIRSSIADSFIRSLPVAHWGIDEASPDDITEVSNAVGTKFTARTVYVTDGRFDIKNEGPSNDIDVFKFTEPTLAEIAACFHMPIELIAATNYLQSSNDFAGRYAEWIEHIKMKQQIIASIFERKIFNRIFPDGVKVKFNSPATVDTSQLVVNIGYAVQSNAITPEMAREILVRNNVFGPYTDDILGNATQKVNTDETKVQTQKVINDTNNASNSASDESVKQ